MREYYHSSRERRSCLGLRSGRLRPLCITLVIFLESPSRRVNLDNAYIERAEVLGGSIAFSSIPYSVLLSYRDRKVTTHPVGLNPRRDRGYRAGYRYNCAAPWGGSIHHSWQPRKARVDGTKVWYTGGSHFQ